MICFAAPSSWRCPKTNHKRNVAKINLIMLLTVYPFCLSRVTRQDMAGPERASKHGYHKFFSILLFSRFSPNQWLKLINRASKEVLVGIDPLVSRWESISGDDNIRVHFQSRGHLQDLLARAGYFRLNSFDKECSKQLLRSAFPSPLFNLVLESAFVLVAQFLWQKQRREFHHANTIPRGSRRNGFLSEEFSCAIPSSHFDLKSHRVQMEETSAAAKEAGIVSLENLAASVNCLSTLRSNLSGNPQWTKCLHGFWLMLLPPPKIANGRQSSTKRRHWWTLQLSLEYSSQWWLPRSSPRRVLGVWSHDQRCLTVSQECA